MDRISECAKPGTSYSILNFFFVYEYINEGIFAKKIERLFLENGREQANCARNTHLLSPSSDVTYPIFQPILHISNSGFHILIQRSLYHPSQSSQIQKKLYGPVFDCEGDTYKTSVPEETVKTDEN